MPDAWPTSTSNNPYAPPSTSLERPEPNSVNDRAVGLRRKNRGNETIFQAIGVVNLLGAGLGVVWIAIASAFLFNRAEILTSSWDGRLWLVNFFLVLPALVVIHLALWLGLRRFRSWAFWGQVLLSVAAIASLVKLWVIGWGTDASVNYAIAAAILSGVTHFAILCCLLGSNTRRIVSYDYREAVHATPDVRSRLGCSLVVIIVPFSIATESGLLYVVNDVTNLVGPFFR